MMTPRENLLSTMRRQGFESVPVDYNLCPSQVEHFQKRFGHTDYLSYFKVPGRHCGIAMEKTFTDIKSLYPRETLPDNTVVDEWGVGHSKQENCYHMTHMHHPLAGDVTLDEIRNYPLPRITDTAEQELKVRVDQLHSQGLAAIGSMACTLWEIGWYMRSMDDLMADMMMDDERALIHFDRLAEHARKRAALYARAGVDIIVFGDDVGMQHSIMMSLDLWSKWLKPRFKEVVATAKNVKPDLLAFYHSCGYIIPFIPHLIEVGVDILNPIQPECMSFKDVHALAKGKLSYWGTIGTQALLPFGTPREVKEAVRANLSLCGKAGGLVVAPTHLVEPEVPWENLVAMSEAANEFKP